MPKLVIFPKLNLGFRRDRRGADAAPLTEGNADALRNASPKAVIYRSEIDYLSRCILDYPDTETGGQLFGFWTAMGTPVVAYVIGPGTDAHHNPVSFVQDQEYLSTIGRELHTRYRLQHIGEWHSHHRIGLANPSAGDVNTMQYGVGKPGFPRMLLCIGNLSASRTTVNAFNFHENKPGEYTHAAWDIVEETSPYRLLADAAIGHLLIHPATAEANHGNLYTLEMALGKANGGEHWLLRSPENVEIMKRFVDIVNSRFPDKNVKSQMLPTGEPQIAVGGADLCIKFPYAFPRLAPVLTTAAGKNIGHVPANAWEIGEESLEDSFSRWLGIVRPLSSGRDKSKHKAEKHAAKAKATQAVDPIMPNLSELQQKSDETVFGPVRGFPVTDEERAEFDSALRRADALVKENEVLYRYIPQKAFTWVNISDNPVVCILAYPFNDWMQCIVRLSLPKDFPQSAPTVKYGFYEAPPRSGVTLPRHFKGIEFKDIDHLFPEAPNFYRDMLQWSPESSLLRAYITASLIIYYTRRALKERTDIAKHLLPFVEDPDKLNKMIGTIADNLLNLNIEENG